MTYLLRASLLFIPLWPTELNTIQTCKNVRSIQTEWWIERKTPVPCVAKRRRFPSIESPILNASCVRMSPLAGCHETTSDVTTGSGAWQLDVDATTRRRTRNTHTGSVITSVSLAVPKPEVARTIPIVLVAVSWNTWNRKAVPSQRDVWFILFAWFRVRAFSLPSAKE